MMTDSLHIKGIYFLFSLAAFFLAFLLRFSSSPNSVRVLFAGLASAPWFLFLLAIIKSPFHFHLPTLLLFPRKRKITHAIAGYLFNRNKKRSTSCENTIPFKMENFYFKIIICMKETFFREVYSVPRKTKRFSRPTRLLYTIINREREKVGML